MTLADSDASRLADALDKALAEGEPEAAKFYDVIPFLRVGGVVLEEILNSDGSLSDLLGMHYVV